MTRAAAYAANAPLMGVPGAAAPPGGQGEWFRGAGGLRLRMMLVNDGRMPDVADTVIQAGFDVESALVLPDGPLAKG